MGALTIPAAALALLDMFVELRRLEYAEYRLFESGDSWQALKTGAVSFFLNGLPFMLRGFALSVNDLIIVIALQKIDHAHGTQKADAVLAGLQAKLFVDMLNLGFVGPAVRATGSRSLAKAKTASASGNTDECQRHLRELKLRAHLAPWQGLGYAGVFIVGTLALSEPLTRWLMPAEFHDDRDVMNDALAALMLFQLSAGLKFMLNTVASNMQIFNSDWQIKYAPFAATMVFIVIGSNVVGIPLVANEEGAALKYLILANVIGTAMTMGLLWVLLNRHIGRYIAEPTLLQEQTARGALEMQPRSQQASQAAALTGPMTMHRSLLPGSSGTAAGSEQESTRLCSIM